MWGDLERVLVRPPLPEDTGHVERYGWRGVPDAAAAAAEHEELRALLEAAGAEVIVSSTTRATPMRSTSTTPSSSATTEPCSYAPARKDASASRRASARAWRRRESRSSHGWTHPPRPRAATLSGSTTTRCSSATAIAPARPGSRHWRRHFPGVEVIALDLPHWVGASEVMHLMSLISPLDRDLALVYPRIAPVRLLELLAERGIEVVEVPGRGVRVDGLQRARARAASRARARGERRDAPPPREGRRRRRHLPRRPHLTARRRRPDLPHPAVAALR